MTKDADKRNMPWSTLDQSEFTRWPRAARFETDFLSLCLLRDKIVREAAGVNVEIWSDEHHRFLKVLSASYERASQLPKLKFRLSGDEILLASGLFIVSGVSDRSRYEALGGEFGCDAEAYQAPEQVWRPEYSHLHYRRLLGFAADCLEAVSSPAAAFDAFSQSGVVSANLAVYEKFYVLLYLAALARIDGAAAVSILRSVAPLTPIDVITDALEWCKWERSRQVDT